MILENAKILLKDKVIDGFVRIDGTSIAEVSEGYISGEDRLDIHSLYLAPGIIELHSHGGGDMTSSMTMMRRS